MAPPVLFVMLVVRQCLFTIFLKSYSTLQATFLYLAFGIVDIKYHFKLSLYSVQYIYTEI